jgi:hypothetical protein
VQETQYDVDPIELVPGVKAETEPVPPVGVEYHNKPVPFAPIVAVNTAAVAPCAYITGEVTVGDVGIIFIVMLTAVRELSQLFKVCDT